MAKPRIRFAGGLWSCENEFCASCGHETPEQAYRAWVEADEWIRAMKWYARNGASV